MFDRSKFITPLTIDLTSAFLQNSFSKWWLIGIKRVVFRITEASYNRES
jgi:hypothetical protein